MALLRCLLLPADFLRSMYKRVDWKAFLEGAQSVGAVFNTALTAAASSWCQHDSSCLLSAWLCLFVAPHSECKHMYSTVPLASCDLGVMKVEILTVPTSVAAEVAK